MTDSMTARHVMSPRTVIKNVILICLTTFLIDEAHTNTAGEMILMRGEWRRVSGSDQFFVYLDLSFINLLIRFNHLKLSRWAKEWTRNETSHLLSEKGVVGVGEDV